MRVFLTGATGFIGRHLLDQLDGSRAELVVCLVRDPARLAGKSPRPTYVRAIAGDLLEPAKYAAELASCDVVCHLAASLGKATLAEHFRVNAEGTRSLLDAAHSAGIRRFLHVSTISVNFPDKTHYAYARSKELAESIVRSSSMDWAIVRPTIVLGPGSGWGKKLRSLATAPVPLLFGSGKARLQPVDVRDVARFLAALLREPELGRETIELGGPEALTFDELVARIRGGPARIAHIPAAPLVAALAALERVAFAALPVTAGQFYGFLHDTTAAPHAHVAQLLPNRRSLDSMIAELGEDRDPAR